MSVSKMLEQGRAGEYFAIFKLISNGVTAFLSEQGLNYDIVVDINGKLYKGQVKTTSGHRDIGKSKCIARFGTRTGKGNGKPTHVNLCDFYAFVSIEDELVAFVPCEKILSRNNVKTISQTVELRSIKYHKQMDRVMSKKTAERKMIFENFDAKSLHDYFSKKNPSYDVDDFDCWGDQC